MDITNPRPNYAFMFYSERLNDFWIIPSIDLDSKLAYKNKNGKNKGRYRIDLSGKENGMLIPKAMFNGYRGNNGFKVLDNIFMKL